MTLSWHLEGNFSEGVTFHGEVFGRYVRGNFPG